MGDRSLLSLLAGGVLVAVGVVFWAADLRAIHAGVDVTGRFTGEYDRQHHSSRHDSGFTLHPHVEFDLPGGGSQTLVLVDEMAFGDFAPEEARVFRYLPGAEPALRLPERLSPWGNPAAWWALGIGAIMVLGALADRRRHAGKN